MKDKLFQIVRKEDKFPAFNEFLRRNKEQINETAVVRMVLKMVGNAAYSLMVGNAINILIIRM